MEYKQVLGIGAVVIAGFLVWNIFRKKELVDPYAGTIYEGMTEQQAWAHYQQLLDERARQEAIWADYERSQAEREAALAEMEKYIEDPTKAEQEHLDELGITKEELPTYQEFALQINESLGGSYVAGILTPPAYWTNSVYEWSKYVQRVTNERWHQLYG